MCICLFCNQTSRFIYRSGACFDATLFTISTSYSQSNKSIGWGSTRKPCIWTIYPARPSNGKHRKIVQYYNIDLSVLCILGTDHIKFCQTLKVFIFFITFWTFLNVYINVFLVCPFFWHINYTKCYTLDEMCLENVIKY